MIVSSTPAMDLKEATGETEFHVQPPSVPLVAASDLSLSKSKAGNVLIEWTENETRHDEDVLTKARETFLAASRKEVAKYPKSARAHTNLGIALMNQSKVEDAVRELEYALQLVPGHYVAAMTLAKIRVDQGRLDEAEHLYSMLQEVYPNESAPSISLAFIAMKRFDFNAAEHQFRQAIAVDPDAVLPKYLLSMVLLRLGKNREAISLLKAAVRSDVRSPLLYQALGAAYAIAGNASRAELNFRSALKLAPGLGSAVQGLTSVLLDQGKAGDAIDILTDYLETVPGDVRAREVLARAYGAVRQYRSAVHQFVQVFSAIEGETGKENHERKGRIAAEIGTYLALNWEDQDAEKWLVRAIEFAPKLGPVPYENLARLYLRSGREKEAIRACVDCKRLFPDSQDTNLLLANAYESLGDYDRAIAELTPRIDNETADSRSYSAIGCLYELAGHSSTAISMLRKGHERYLEDLTIIHNLAYVLISAGQIEEGAALLRQYERELAAYAEGVPVYEAILIATWGLIDILKGDAPSGSERYKQAAKIASRLGDRELAGSIMRKMHLELAKSRLNRKDYVGARREIEAGLEVKRGRQAFLRSLRRLQLALPTAAS